MIMYFSLGYQSHDLTQEQADKLSTLVKDNPVINVSENSYKYTRYAGDIDQIARELPGLHLQVETGELAGTAFQEIIRRLGAIESAIASGGYGNAQTLNAKVNVHVPGLGLLMIDEVEVITNECTHSLQDYLQEGWRILAICPQPDQRRPDYVIGRTKKRD